jgi:hypothetical protein
MHMTAESTAGSSLLRLIEICIPRNTLHRPPSFSPQYSGLPLKQ